MKNNELEKQEMGQKPPKKKTRNRKIDQQSKPSTVKSKPKPKSTADPTVVMKCAVCSQSFDSRNKLFKHIEVTGHAVAATSKSKSKKNK